ncbi:helix-turn-helix domain-containing protein [Bartonella sp. B39]
MTFQQIQKYEKWLNHTEAERLQKIADTLDVPLSFFHTDISTKENASYHHDDRIPSKIEYLLLQGFRVLKPEKQKTILQLIYK